MPASKAQQRAVSKYMKESYDEIKIRMGKGTKETIQAAAAAVGESVNAYINAAISQRMERDAARGPQEAATAHARVGKVSMPSDKPKAAQEGAELETEAGD